MRRELATLSPKDTTFLHGPETPAGAEKISVTVKKCNSFFELMNVNHIFPRILIGKRTLSIQEKSLIRLRTADEDSSTVRWVLRPAAPGCQGKWTYHSLMRIASERTTHDQGTPG